MTQTGEKTVAPRAADLGDEVREGQAGQHAASERRIVKDLLHATEDFCP
jgi:hypothetical protein